MAPIPRISRLEFAYQVYLADQDAAAFIGRVAAIYTLGTLARLASAPRRPVRRAAVLALGFLGDYECNAVLGKALVDEDRGVRIAAENGIRAVWCRDGSTENRHSLGLVVRYNGTRQFQQAIDVATELIQSAPWFAEAWNQRAIAYYSLGEYRSSIRDCREVLEMNPYHFGAAAGIGQCHLQLGEVAAALDAFRRALRLNPNMEGVRANIVQLERASQQE